jgi:hypothetical protein
MAGVRVVTGGGTLSFLHDAKTDRDNITMNKNLLTLISILIYKFDKVNYLYPALFLFWIKIPPIIRSKPAGVV